jgi:hypothetical protein
MNIALERCKEISEGRVTRNWGDAFVRGNNGIYFSTLAFTPLYTNSSAVTYICADNA